MQSVWAHQYAVHRHKAAALLSYTDPTWLRFWWSGSLVELNDVIMSWLRLPSYSTASHIHFRHIQSILADWYAVNRYTVAAHSVIPPYLAQILVIWVTARVTTAKKPVQQWWQCQLIDNGHASKTRAMTPALVPQRRQHRHVKGNGTSKRMAIMPAQQADGASVPGWEICLEFCRILWLFQLQTFWTP